MLKLLFGGRKVLSPEELGGRVRALILAHGYRDAVALTDEFRKSANRDRRLEEVERLYLCGVAHFEALFPLRKLAHESGDGDRYAMLRAFFATYCALYQCFGAAKGQMDNQVLLADIQAKLRTASQMYEQVYAEHESGEAERADLEANEIMSAAYRESIRNTSAI